MCIKAIQDVTSTHLDLLLSADPNEALITDYLKRAASFEYRLNDRIVGVIVLLATRPKTLEIVTIAVSEQYQNQGIGEALLRYALKYAQEQNYQTVEIGTGSTSFAQLYLYQKCGFRMTGIDRDFFPRHYPNEIIENKLVLKDMVRLSIDV
ncbi:GNAT family N-acetyltransferase [Erwinia sp. CPCC 100877]|nr:GNAT family N-acetyltransferase [Erwinia sp. CPCC 100877]